MTRVARTILLFLLLVIAGLSSNSVLAADRLTCSISPAGNIPVNSSIQVRAAGGKAPYWLTVATPALVTYTPSKLDRNGNPGGSWNIAAIKPGMATFTVRDAAGATASASVTITANAAATTKPPVIPLQPALSNRAPFTGDTVTLTVSGGNRPYRVMANPSANAEIKQSGDAAWSVRLLRAGEFRLSITDAGQQATAISGVAKDRPMPLMATLDRTKLYWQVRQGSAQQPISLKILTGNPPYSVYVDQNFLNVRQNGTNSFSITSNGRGGDTTITVRDSKMQEKSWSVHAAAPLMIKWMPENRKLKAGEGFTVLILSGEPPFRVKTFDGSSYVGEGIKDKRYAASYFVGGMKAGVHKINVTDASFPATNYGYQLEVSVEP